MTRIDFYILESEGDRAQIACRLAEKAYQQGLRVYIHVDDEAQAQHIDNLLWTFRAGSFVPHTVGAKADSLTPVHIGFGAAAAPEGHEQVLVNLAGTVPAFFSRFERVAEVVDTDETVRRQGREHFRFYRDRGYPLHSHKIS